MKTVPLTQGKEALVDDADYDRVAAHKWYAVQRPGCQTWYAARNSSRADGPRRQILMHREILRVADPAVEVDHRDRDGLNNTRSNLRPCTQAQNSYNRRRRRGPKTSAYHGVHWSKKAGKWKAAITIGGARRHLGYHADEATAAAIYDRAAALYFGEFAALNFPAPSEALA